MKKTLLIVAFSVVLMLSGCGKKEKKFSSYEEDKNAVIETGIESLSQIENANDSEILLTDNENLLLQYKEYGVEEEISKEVYAEKGIVITNTSDDINEVYVDGNIYTSSSNGDGIYFNYPQEVEDIKNGYEHYLIFESTADEVIDKSEKTDMGYKLTTIYTVPQDDTYYPMTFGIVGTQQIKIEYMLDEDYIIQSMKAEYDGKVIQEYKVNFNVEKQELPDFVEEMQNPTGETRKVDIFCDMGDGTQQEYNYVIPKDTFVLVPENMDYREYTDAEYTNILQDTEIDYGDDLEVYLKKVR